MMATDFYIIDYCILINGVFVLWPIVDLVSIDVLDSVKGKLCVLCAHIVVCYLFHLAVVLLALSSTPTSPLSTGLTLWSG